MDISIGDIIRLAASGGSSIIILIIWIYTHRSNTIQNKTSMETLQRAVDLANATSDEAFKKHSELSGVLIQLLKDEQEYKTMLVGILDRLETKLSTPVSCPLAGMKGLRVEVDQ